MMKVMINFDYEGRFNTKSFWGYLKDFYVKYVIKKKIIQGYSPRYRTELVQLHHFMMQRLKMETRDSEYTNIAGVHRRGPG